MSCFDAVLLRTLLSCIKIALNRSFAKHPPSKQFVDQNADKNVCNENSNHFKGAWLDMSRILHDIVQLLNVT